MVEVASAQKNLMGHLVTLAAKSAHGFNDGLCSQRRQMKRVFKLENKLKTLQRERILVATPSFLHCSY